MDNTITLADSQITLNVSRLPEQTIYLLVQWPHLDRLTAYHWFNSECLPYQPNGEPPSPLAALVPLERFAETLQQGINSLQL